MRPAGVFHGDAHVPVVTDKIVGGSKLLGEMRDLIRRKHYSIHTKQAYLEFERSQIIVRNGKGTKDRVTLLPPALVPAIRDQMALAKQLHAKDLAAGLGEVYLPCALARKYPSAARQWGWQYLFPAGNTAVDPRSGKTRRHHLGESAVQRARRPSALPASTSTAVAIP
jgi:integrase